MISFLKKGFFAPLGLVLLFLASCNPDDGGEPLPEVVAGFTQTIDQTTGTVVFTNTSQNANTYLWDFGNGATSTSTNPTQIFTNGTYTVTLTATNTAGDSDTASASIVINIPDEGFDSGLIENGDFEDGAGDWFTNFGDNIPEIRTENGNSFFFANVETANPDQPFLVNLSKVVAITQGTNYTLSFQASSDRARTIIAGLGLNEAPFTNTSVVVNLTTEPQVFTLQLSAADFGGANSRILFDLAGAVGTVVIDNVRLVEGGDGSDSQSGSDFDSGLLTNGDFENGTDPWFVNFGDNTVPTQTDGGNTFFIANIENAVPAQPFLVNLSQVVAITQGTNYTLTFKASSDRERTIIAGIGLNEAPFTNSSPIVNLTTETQTFTLQLTAADFGGANSRVLFDLAGDAGVVVIDEVSLVVGGDGSDSNGGGGGGEDTGSITACDGGTLLNDFESADNSIFNNFGGGVGTIIDNPATNVNSSAKIGQYVKNAGEPFAGITIALNENIALNNGVFSIDVKSSAVRQLLFKLEGPGVERILPTSGEGWQTINYDFNGDSGTVTAITLIMDNGTQGDGSADWTIQYDNIRLCSNDGDGGGSGTVKEFCNTSIKAFGGDAGSDILLSIFNVDAQTMRVEIKSADNDPVDLLVLPAGAWVPNNAGISLNPGPVEGADGVYAGEFFFPQGAPENVELFIEWSKVSFGGNWRSTAPGTLDKVAFNAQCEGSGGGGNGGGNTGDGSGFVIDFEDGGSLTGAFDGGANGANADNPDASGINTSSKVYQFNKIVGSAWYSGMFNIFNQNISATGGKTFKVKVWSPNANVNFRFQLEKEGNQGAVVTYNKDVMLMEANTWVELTFDFSTTAINLADGYDKIVIFPDYDESDQSAVAVEAIYYIDDIVQQ